MDDQFRDAHKFAAERHITETRVFWTRVAALLTVNSVLIAGFTILYGSDHFNDTLLLAIAAAGIAIQAMWPLFAITSYSSDRYWRYLMRAVEPPLPEEEEKRSAREDSIQRRVESKWICYERYHKEFFQRWFRWFTRLFGSYPAGTATMMLCFIFLAIWIVAAVIVNVCCVWRALTIGIPSVIFLIILVLCIYSWIRTRNAPI